MSRFILFMLSDPVPASCHALSTDDGSKKQDVQEFPSEPLSHRRVEIGFLGWVNINYKQKQHSTKFMFNENKTKNIAIK